MNELVCIDPNTGLRINTEEENLAEIRKSIKWHMRMPKVLKSLTNPPATCT